MIPRIALAALLGLLAGLGGYTFFYAQGISYFSNDPRACVNCHIMREAHEGWLKASHHAHATCNDCHVPQDFLGKYVSKAVNGYNHSKGFTLQDFHEPLRITPANRKALRENCLRCHANLVGELVVHDRAGDVLDCVRCHARVGHGPIR